MDRRQFIQAGGAVALGASSISTAFGQAKTPIKVGILIGVAHRWAAGRQIVRVAGGGVALAGLFFLWRAIA